MSQDRLHLFGIRHHGPGCAHSLIKALDEVQPDTVLVEGPPEANDILEFVDGDRLKLPVAILVYYAQDPGIASFYPFAEFSPEWQAFCWAIRNNKPVRFIDLPASYTLSKMLDEKEQAEGLDAEGIALEVIAEDENSEQPEVDQDELLISSDPLSILAKVSGYEDGESWWNNLIEQNSHARELFVSIESAMTALRESGAGIKDDEDEHKREMMREAHMRLEIAKSLKAEDGPVAVVCGAWHVPALRKKVAQKDDRVLLKGMPKVKTQVTWIPWTDTRLQVASGYGAGILSPGWYHHLWKELSRLEGDETLQPRRLTSRWQTEVARLLRDKGIGAATASVIEACRLAETLAVLRGVSVPGLADMRDASLSALCYGEKAPLEIIETELVIGNRVGGVSEDVPQMPLQADLTKCQKKVKLKPEALERELSVDLRSESGYARSVLLHRLNFINIPWGELTDAGRSRGTFREKWELSWQPEYSVRLAEALIWGNTVEEAASKRALALMKTESSLKEQAELIKSSLLADLPEAARKGIDYLQEHAVEASNVSTMLETVPPLADILRYGTARKMPVDGISHLVEGLIEKIHIGLVYSCRNLEPVLAGEMCKLLESYDRALHIFEDGKYLDAWADGLRKLTEDDDCSAIIQGFAVRRLYDLNRIESDLLLTKLSAALSPALESTYTAAWLEGFLGEAGQILLHDDELFKVIDEWIMSLGEDDFVEYLPLLRRTTGRFDSMERKHLIQKVQDGKASSHGDYYVLDENSEAFEKALPLLKTILGLKDE